MNEKNEKLRQKYEEEIERLNIAIMKRTYEDKIKRMHEKCEEQIKELKIMQKTQMEKNHADQEDEAKRITDSYEEKIKELNATNKEKEDEREKEQKEEIRMIRDEYEEMMRNMNETHEEHKNNYKNCMKSKDLQADYVLKVLEDSESMIHKWQKTIKEQAKLIDESYKKIQEYKNIE